MKTHEIAKSEWTTFFDAFSKNHPGFTAVIHVIGADLGAQEAAHDLSFVGISAERKGSEKDSIVILLGDEFADHMEHRVLDPVRVWYRAGSAGTSDAFEIESRSGTKTIIELQPVPELAR